MAAADAIAGAKGLLPVWVGWANLLLWPALAFCIALLATWAGGRAALRLAGGPSGRSWAEDAARAWPVRRALGFSMVLSTAVPAALVTHFHGPLSTLPVGWQGALVGAAALCGGILACRDFPARLGDPKPKKSLRTLAVVLFLIVPNLVVLFGLIVLLPWAWSVRTLVLLAGGIALSWAAARGAGIGPLRLLGIARPPSPRLAAIVSETAVRIGATPSSVWEIDCGIPNAFAFPVSGRLCFTTRALEVLDDGQARAICAHELGHLLEPASVKALRLVSVLIILPLAAGPAIALSFGPAVLLALVCVVFATLFATLALRRRMEARADVFAREHESSEGEYARALEKLHEAARAPMVLPGKGQLHGHLFDRMAAAGAAPAYERPAPPRRLPMIAGVVVSGTLLVVLVSGVLVSFVVAIYRTGGTEAGRLLDLAVRGGSAASLAHLAELRFADGRSGDALALYEAAEALDRRAIYYPSRRALLLLEAGRCHDAALALAEAWVRAPAEGPLDGMLGLADEAMRRRCSRESLPGAS